MSETLLEVRNLRKSYGKLEAVRGTSFSLRRGQCFGLLGPNGAGKSTTIEIIQGVKNPTSGEILFDGRPVQTSDLQRIGIQFQQTELPQAISVKETIELFSSLYDSSSPIDEIVNRFRLEAFQSQKSNQISGGQKQRLTLALALCHNPDLVLLDEPTTGLDPQARRHLWDLIASIQSEGKTILLTTHYMEEAFELCDEIAIMDHGEIIEQGNPKHLLANYFNTTLVEIPKASLPLSSVSLSVDVIERDEDYRMETTDVNALLKELVHHDVDLSNMRLRKSNLEDLFIRLTGKGLRS